MKIPFPVRAVPALTFRAWLTPPPLGSRLRERDSEALAPMASGPYGVEIGEGPVILALHGWGGRPAQMVPIARELAGAGYRVIVPEMPGHAGGSQTDVLVGAATLRSLVEELDPVGVVGHSFASLVMRLAFADGAPDSVVLVAPALDVRDALDVFSRRLRLLPWADRSLRRRVRRWDPELWPVMSNLHPEQMPGADILILHDPEDVDTPYERSLELAAQRARADLIPVPDTGHSGILESNLTLDRIVRFMRRTAPTAMSDAGKTGHAH